MQGLKALTLLSLTTNSNIKGVPQQGNQLAGTTQKMCKQFHLHVLFECLINTCDTEILYYFKHELLALFSSSSLFYLEFLLSLFYLEFLLSLFYLDFFSLSFNLISITLSLNSFCSVYNQQKCVLESQNLALILAMKNIKLTSENILEGCFDICRV